jgi:hypothetical protein
MRKILAQLDSQIRRGTKNVKIKIAKKCRTTEMMPKGAEFIHKPSPDPDEEKIH